MSYWTGAFLGDIFGNNNSCTYIYMARNFSSQDFKPRLRRSDDNEEEEVEESMMVQIIGFCENGEKKLPAMDQIPSKKNQKRAFLHLKIGIFPAKRKFWT